MQGFFGLWIISVQKIDLPGVGLARPPNPLCLFMLHASTIHNVKYIYTVIIILFNVIAVIFLIFLQRFLDISIRVTPYSE
jgi:hypothetical protein